jgi:hypothetical protein
MSPVLHVQSGSLVSRLWRPRPSPAPRVESPPSRNYGIVTGYLSPHPLHLIYDEDSPPNEPRSRGGFILGGVRTISHRLMTLRRPRAGDIGHSDHGISTS